MLIWTEEGKRERQMERGVWPGPLHVLLHKPDPGSSRLQWSREAPNRGPRRPHCLAAGSVPASAGPRGGGRGRRATAAAPSTSCTLCDPDPAGQHLLPHPGPVTPRGAPGAEMWRGIYAHPALAD